MCSSDLWKLKINLLWKMCWNILPTCSVLNNRFALPSLDCPLCNNAPETLKNLFLHCEWAAQIWLLAPWPLVIHNLAKVSIVDWIKAILYPSSKLGLDDEVAREFQLYVAISCDQLWWARNKARVEGINSNPIELARQILQVFQEHKQAWKVQSVRPKKDVSWLPPPSNWIKMNFDSAIREEKNHNRSG